MNSRYIVIEFRKSNGSSCTYRHWIHNDREGKKRAEAIRQKHTVIHEGQTNSPKYYRKGNNG